MHFGSGDMLRNECALFLAIVPSDIGNDLESYEETPTDIWLPGFELLRVVRRLS